MSRAVIHGPACLSFAGRVHRCASCARPQAYSEIASHHTSIAKLPFTFLWRRQRERSLRPWHIVARTVSFHLSSLLSLAGPLGGTGGSSLRLSTLAFHQREQAHLEAQAIKLGFDVRKEQLSPNPSTTPPPLATKPGDAAPRPAVAGGQRPAAADAAAIGKVERARVAPAEALDRARLADVERHHMLAAKALLDAELRAKVALLLIPHFSHVIFSFLLSTCTSSLVSLFLSSALLAFLSPFVFCLSSFFPSLLPFLLACSILTSFTRPFSWSYSLPPSSLSSHTHTQERAEAALRKLHEERRWRVRQMQEQQERLRRAGARNRTPACAGPVPVPGCAGPVPVPVSGDAVNAPVRGGAVATPRETPRGAAPAHPLPAGAVVAALALEKARAPAPASCHWVVREDGGPRDREPAAGRAKVADGRAPVGKENHRENVREIVKENFKENLKEKIKENLQPEIANLKENLQQQARPRLGAQALAKAMGGAGAPGPVQATPAPGAHAVGLGAKGQCRELENARLRDEANR